MLASAITRALPVRKEVGASERDASSMRTAMQAKNKIVAYARKSPSKEQVRAITLSLVSEEGSSRNSGIRAITCSPTDLIRYGAHMWPV